MLIAVVVVVVVIVVILALALTGVLPFFKSSSGGNAASSSFSGSRAAAQSAANGYPGGSWSLFGAAGVAPSASASVPTSNLTGVVTSSGCTTTLAATAPATISVSAMSDVSGGLSDAWLFLFKNSSGNTVLLVDDISGSASVIGTLGGSNCFMGALGFITTIGSNVVDSTAAAATANSAGGSAFIAAHPGAFAAFNLIAGASAFGFTTPSTWSFDYSACAFSSTATGTAAQFTATIDATTGALKSASNTTTTCTGFFSGNGTTGPGGGGTPISSALALGTPTVYNQTYVWTYNVSVESASGLTLNDLSFAVKKGGTPINLGIAAAVEVYTTGTSPVGAFYFSSTSWVLGGSLTVSVPMTFEIVVSQYLGGATLVVSGVGSFSGSISVSLPTG
ncbi:MAG TPA: hypothetical protein VEY07_04315 [Thermoplasmata archaeon]|nr:hypothetical protein [Thermoplasmata archaeon]